MIRRIPLILLLLAWYSGAPTSSGQELDPDFPFELPPDPELSAEEKALSTPELFAALIEIIHQPDRVTSNKYNDREDAFWRELSERDRVSHEWLAERMLTTTDQKEAHRAMTLLTDSYSTRKPKHLDIAREAVIAGVARSLRKEKGSADRVLLAASFFNVGQPGDFPILAPFLETAGVDLASTLYQVASRVVGTEEDLPLLRHYAERWRMEVQHVSPDERAFRQNKANFAFSSIQRLEERLAAEAAAGEAADPGTPPAQDELSPLAAAGRSEDTPPQEPPDRRVGVKWLVVSLLAALGLLAVSLAKRARSGKGRGDG